MPKCNACKQFVSSLGERFSKATGVFVPYKRCASCRTKDKSRYQLNGAEQRKKQKLPENRARERKLSKKPARKAVKSAYVAKYNATPEGLASKKRGWTTRRAKVMASPGHRLQESLMAGIRERLRGERHAEESVRMSKYTEFATIEDLLQHFKNEMESKPGMTTENYGKFWSIAHRIPQRYYDFSDPEEIMRCNAKANLGCDYEVRPNPLNELTNHEKNDVIPSDIELEAIGKEHWPKAFGDKLSPQRRVQLRASRFIRD